jgi:hypothetical protein
MEEEKNEAQNNMAKKWEKKNNAWKQYICISEENKAFGLGL